MADIILGIPTSILALNQKGLLERAFHDGLFPNLAYRAEAMPEEWPANTGSQQFQTRPGLLAPSVLPITPGQDPSSSQVPYEQWVAQLAQFGGSIDTHMPTSVTSSANLFLRNIKQLGLQAGQSVNRIARNALFQAYLSGQTVSIAATGSSDTTLRVASLNGFTDVIILGSNVAPQPVSTQYPLPITIGTGSTAASNTVVGFSPDTQSDPTGPGTLTLGSTVGAVFAARSTVMSAYAPIIVRSAPGNSVDAISAADGITLQQCINAAAFLRRANVQPHDDGFFHVHVSALGAAQFFADPVFQRLNQSLPEYVIYKEGFMGQMAGMLFFLNLESPESFNTGAQVATSGLGILGSEIGGEVVNGTGVNIGRAIITGKGAIYERYLDESAYMTEAGTTGKTGEFSVSNSGLQILTERIRLILRAPLDKLQQVVSTSWSISTSFPTPSDITAPSGAQRFKRSVVLEYAT
jgi:hypothetical protein